MITILLIAAAILIQLVIFIYFKDVIAFILVDKLDFTKLTKRDLFSSDVMEVYLLAIEHPEYFSCDMYTMNITGKDFSIWTANTITARRFYTYTDSDNYQQVEEMNSKLTMYDKRLLDKLCTAVKEGELHNLEVFFDIEITDNEKEETKANSY